MPRILIGHNSANAEIDPNETIRERERDANRLVKQFADTDVECEQRCTAIICDAIVGICALIVAIVESCGLPEYYRSRGIPVHGNTKNLFQPMVANVWRNQDETPNTRQNIWRCSAVIYVAFKMGISQHAMPDWLREHGVDKIAADYKKMRSGEEPTHDISDAKLAANICVPKGEYTAIPATPLTVRLRKGKHLVVVDCNPDSGEWHIVAVLRRNEKQVETAMAADARRRFAAGK
jgi:hypothetical protein